VFSDHFDIPIIKIIFLKKYHLNIFSNKKNILKKIILLRKIYDAQFVNIYNI